MAVSGESYYKLLEMVNNQYLGLHNLNQLRHVESKIACYDKFLNKPSDYYECFIQAEASREGEGR